MRIYAKKVNRNLGSIIRKLYLCKQKMRIYAKKVNRNGSKKRPTSEQTH